MKMVNLRGVYHLPYGSGYGKIDGHDVVVLRQSKRTKKYKVASITSLEYQNRITHQMQYRFSALDRVKKDLLTPVPVKELGTQHWSGLDHRYVYVSASSLRPAKIAKAKFVKSKFLK